MKRECDQVQDQHAAVTVASEVRDREQAVRIGLGFYAVYVGVVLLLFPIHCAAHFIAYRIVGVQVLMTFFSVTPTAGAERVPIPELAAPLLNLAIATGASWAYHKSARHRMLYAAVTVSAALTRLGNYVLITTAAGLTGTGMSVIADESSAAHLWGLPSLLFVGLLTVPFASLTWSVVRTFAPSSLRCAGHLAALALVTQALSMLAGNILDPWFFPLRR